MRVCACGVRWWGGEGKGYWHRWAAEVRGTAERGQGRIRGNLRSATPPPDVNRRARVPQAG